jgi:hypothetical protein
MRAFALALFLSAIIVPGAAAAGGCGSFGVDDTPVSNVQASWGPAERLVADGSYSKALIALHGSARYLPTIHDPFIRACVASGSDLRIAAATAGANVLTRNPADVKGAAAAAHDAWIHFPSRHDCP